MLTEGKVTFFFELKKFSASSFCNDTKVLYKDRGKRTFEYNASHSTHSHQAQIFAKKNKKSHPHLLNIVKPFEKHPIASFDDTETCCSNPDYLLYGTKKSPSSPRCFLFATPQKTKVLPSFLLFPRIILSLENFSSKRIIVLQRKNNFFSRRKNLWRECIQSISTSGTRWRLSSGNVGRCLPG